MENKKLALWIEISIKCLLGRYYNPLPEESLDREAIKEAPRIFCKEVKGFYKATQICLKSGFFSEMTDAKQPWNNDFKVLKIIFNLYFWPSKTIRQLWKPNKHILGNKNVLQFVFAVYTLSGKKKKKEYKFTNLEYKMQENVNMTQKFNIHKF